MTSELVLQRFTGWMLPDDALDVITGLISESRPATIFEAGSGRSTVVFASAARDIDARLVSLEHLPEFAGSTAATLSANGLDDNAEVRLAPLEPHGLDLAAPDWYSRRGWADVQGIDMLIVDGPPGHTAERAREPALPLLHDRLSRGCVVVLDDLYRRRAEPSIWKAWQKLGLSLPTIVPHSGGALAHGTMP